jgi:hypothetical protein
MTGDLLTDRAAETKIKAFGHAYKREQRHEIFHWHSSRFIRPCWAGLRWKAPVLSTDVQKDWCDYQQSSSTAMKKTMLRSARHVYRYAMPRGMTKHVILQLCLKSAHCNFD